MKHIILLLVLTILFPACASYGYEYEDFLDSPPRICEKAITDSAKIIANEYNLTYLVDGGSITPLKKCHWSYSFLSHNLLTPQEGKELILKLREAIVDGLDKNKNVIDYLYSNKDLSVAVPLRRKLPYPATISKELIGIKITFWTKDFDRIKPPHIAQIVVSPKGTSYYFANPDDSLGPEQTL